MKKIKFKYSKPEINLVLAAILALITGCNKSEEFEAELANPNIITSNRLPFGGPKVLIRNQGDATPLFESLWLCGLPSDGAGNDNADDWTNADGTWDYTRKPQVEGNAVWISEFEVSLDGNGNRIITGNALPSHPTGDFPIKMSSPAYKYDGNPNIITDHPILYTFPAIPKIADEPGCVPFGPSGISLSGSAIYHGASTLGNDAAAHEMLDRFGGHTDGTERYHYHYPAPDLMDHIAPHSGGHSELMGYMLDGFGIYGPYGEDGKLLRSSNLDECHGHTHPVMWDGEIIEIYHYHWTYDFPYNIGCFKGTKQ